MNDWSGRTRPCLLLLNSTLKTDQRAATGPLTNLSFRQVRWIFQLKKLTACTCAVHMKNQGRGRTSLPLTLTTTSGTDNKIGDQLSSSCDSSKRKTEVLVTIRISRYIIHEFSTHLVSSIWYDYTRWRAITNAEVPKIRTGSYISCEIPLSGNLREVNALLEIYNGLTTWGQFTTRKPTEVNIRTNQSKAIEQCKLTFFCIRLFICISSEYTYVRFQPKFVVLKNEE